jgi:hypothetical protein
MHNILILPDIRPIYCISRIQDIRSDIQCRPDTGWICGRIFNSTFKCPVKYEINNRCIEGFFPILKNSVYLQQSSTGTSVTVSRTHFWRFYEFTWLSSQFSGYLYIKKRPDYPARYPCIPTSWYRYAFKKNY